MFNMIFFTSVVICISLTNGLLFDVIGELNNLDAFLVKYCRPIDPPANGKVSCTYSPTELTCRGSCNPGYYFDGLPSNTAVAYKCNTRSIWSDGNSFPTCIRGTGPTGVIQPTAGIGKCIDRLDACPAEGDYQACTACNQFVTCAPDGIFLTTCPAPTVWDDNEKKCVMISKTCS